MKKLLFLLTFITVNINTSASDFNPNSFYKMLEEVSNEINQEISASKDPIPNTELTTFLPVLNLSTRKSSPNILPEEMLIDQNLLIRTPVREHKIDQNLYKNSAKPSARGLSQNALQNSEKILPGQIPKEKKHICEWAGCGKSFITPSKLERHKRVHTGEKPFKCTTCSKAFSQKPNLKTHMNTHTGKKPFKCTICGTGFTLKHHLTEHRKNIHGEE